MSVNVASCNATDISPVSPLSRKRHRKSTLSQSVTADGYDSQEDAPVSSGNSDGRPVTKRARRNDDDREEHDTEYDDVKNQMRDEDYDEYLDEGGGGELSDIDQYRDV